MKNKNFDDAVENLGLTSEFNGMIEELKKEISDNLTKRISFTPIEPAKQNHFTFKKKTEKKKFIFSVCGVILSLIISLIGIVIYKTSNKVLFDYNIKNEVNTKVILDDKEFYSNNVYVASLINSILVEFNNNLLLNENYNYDKSLIAKVEIVDSNDANSIVYEYKDELLKNIKGTFEGNKIDTVMQSIDYKKYNSISNKYKNKIKFATSSKLRIIYTNNISTKSGVKEKIVNEIVLPLSTDTVEIDKIYKPVIKNKVYDYKNNNNLLAVLFGVSGLLFIVFMTNGIIILNKNKNNLTVLEKKYKKIMDNYNNIIEVENDNFDKNMITIDVKYFVDLIDAQQELHVPILCYTDKITGRTWFYMVTDKLLYKYELNKSDEQI